MVREVTVKCPVNVGADWAGPVLYARIVRYYLAVNMGIALSLWSVGVIQDILACCAKVVSMIY